MIGTQVWWKRVGTLVTVLAVEVDPPAPLPHPDAGREARTHLLVASHSTTQWIPLDEVAGTRDENLPRYISRPRTYKLSGDKPFIPHMVEE